MPREFLFVLNDENCFIDIVDTKRRKAHQYGFIKGVVEHLYSFSAD